MPDDTIVHLPPTVREVEDELSARGYARFKHTIIDDDDTGGEEPPIIDDTGGEEPPIIDDTGGEEPPIIDDTGGEEPPIIDDTGGEEPPIIDGEQPLLTGYMRYMPAAVYAALVLLTKERDIFLPY